MKPDIHPKLNPLVLTIRKDKFTTMSTLNKNNLLVDVDFRTHPAWTGVGLGSVSDSNKSVMTFTSKYGADFS